jgi:hypothetical protein
MSITTYAQLQTAIGSWLSHSLFTAQIPDFITLFEAAANRRLRVRQQETTANVTMTAGSGPLPADYLAWRRVTWPGATRAELDYVAPSWLQAAYPSAAAGIPAVFTIEGASITVRPVDNTALQLLYYAKVPALSDVATTNWLLAAHPDLYLFGAMVEAEMFGVNDERMPLWKARRDEIFDEIEKLSNKSRGAGAMRVIGAVV